MAVASTPDKNESAVGFWAFYLGVNFNLDKVGPGGHMGGVKAWDPVKQKSRRPQKFCMYVF